MYNLSENSLEKMTNLLSSDAFQVFDMVDRGCVAIDWERWYSTYTCLEALGLIQEDEKTHFNTFVHTYTFTILGARIWKFYLTTQKYQMLKLFQDSLIFSEK